MKKPVCYIAAGSDKSETSLNYYAGTRAKNLVFPSK